MKREQIEYSTYVQQNKQIDATDLNGEKVMMDLDRGKYFALNEVGSRIWEIINTPTTVEEIINILLLEYDVKTDICKDNVFNFLERLSDNELICIN